MPNMSKGMKRSFTYFTTYQITHGIRSFTLPHTRLRMDKVLHHFAHLNAVLFDRLSFLYFNSTLLLSVQLFLAQQLHSQNWADQDIRTSF